MHKGEIKIQADENVYKSPSLKLLQKFHKILNAPNGAVEDIPKIKKSKIAPMLTLEIQATSPEAF